MYRDSKTIPFQIRSEYGTATVNTDVNPERSDFQSDWIHHSSPDGYREVFFSQYTHYPESKRKNQGRLRQRYCDLQVGQHVALLGSMTVESTEDGSAEGMFLDDARFSTRPKPDFDLTTVGLTWFSQVLSLLHVLAPLGYMAWAASR